MLSRRMDAKHLDSSLPRLVDSELRIYCFLSILPDINDQNNIVMLSIPCTYYPNDIEINSAEFHVH